jgi:hypothetical protein
MSKGAQSYHRFVLRNYDQQMRSIESIRERYTLFGNRIDRAVTIAHGLQQRKFAQYAALVAITIAPIPLFNVIVTVIGWMTQSAPLRILSSFVVLLAIVGGIFEANRLFRRFLSRKGLYVEIITAKE